MRAPQAPGGLGQTVEPMVLRDYLIALDAWLTARRDELAALDDAIMASKQRTELTQEIAVSLQLWNSIQARYQHLLQVWDGGRVGYQERDKLSSLVWGKLDEGPAGASITGLSLPEACRMSDALTDQLRTRLQLDPVGTEALTRLRDLRATMERLRDQLQLEPMETKAQAQSYFASLQDRLTQISQKAARGADIGGLLGPLENDAAKFERDLIVNGAMRRSAGAPDPVMELRQQLIAKSQQLEQLVAQVVATVPEPPKYAIPDVTALGPVPPPGPARQAYQQRLVQVGEAMALIEDSYQQALAQVKPVPADEILKLLTEIARLAAEREQLPANFADQLRQLTDQYASWLASREQA